MNKYEMLYIIAPATTDEAKEAVIAKFEGLVATLGGTVEKTEKWGDKKLAYPIRFKDDGYYVLMTFQAEGNAIAEIQRVARLTLDVERTIITKA